MCILLSRRDRGSHSQETFTLNYGTFYFFGGAYALYTVGMAIATELDYRAVNKK